MIDDEKSSRLKKQPPIRRGSPGGTFPYQPSGYTVAWFSLLIKGASTKANSCFLLFLPEASHRGLGRLHDRSFFGEEQMLTAISPVSSIFGPILPPPVAETRRALECVVPMARAQPLAISSYCAKTGSTSGPTGSLRQLRSLRMPERQRSQWEERRFRSFFERSSHLTPLACFWVSNCRRERSICTELRSLFFKAALRNGDVVTGPACQ